MILKFILKFLRKYMLKTEIINLNKKDKWKTKVLLFFTVDVKFENIDKDFLGLALVGRNKIFLNPCLKQLPLEEALITYEHEKQHIRQNILLGDYPKIYSHIYELDAAAEGIVRVYTTLNKDKRWLKDIIKYEASKYEYFGFPNFLTCVDALTNAISEKLGFSKKEKEAFYAYLFLLDLYTVENYTPSIYKKFSIKTLLPYLFSIMLLLLLFIFTLILFNFNIISLMKSFLIYSALLCFRDLNFMRGFILLCLASFI